MFDFSSHTPATPMPQQGPPPLPDPLPTPPSYAAGAATKATGKGGKIPNAGGTLLTSPMGVTDESSTNTSKKSLLGQ